MNALQIVNVVIVVYLNPDISLYPENGAVPSDAIRKNGKNRNINKHLTLSDSIAQNISCGITIIWVLNFCRSTDFATQRTSSGYGKLMTTWKKGQFLKRAQLASMKT